MALGKYGNKRDKNEKPIIRVLEGVGATVYQLDQPSDLIVGFRGCNYLIEVKDKGGSLTEGQVKFRDTWQGQVAVVWTEDDALRVIGAI